MFGSSAGSTSAVPGRQIAYEQVTRAELLRGAKRPGQASPAQPVCALRPRSCVCAAAALPAAWQGEGLSIRKSRRLLRKRKKCVSCLTFRVRLRSSHRSRKMPYRMNDIDLQQLVQLFETESPVCRSTRVELPASCY